MRRSLLMVLAATMSLATTTVRSEPPEIFAISPDAAPGATEIRIKGRRLQNTEQVWFVFQHPRGKPGQRSPRTQSAGFSVISSRELKVTTPKCLTANAEATVVVVTSEGVAVGLPASTIKVGPAFRQQGRANSFYHVLDGVQLPAKPRPRRPGEPVRRRLPDRDAHPLLVIGKGLVEKRPEEGICLVMEGGTLVRGGRICFVQAGGRVADLSDSFAVFYEPDAILPQAARRAGAFKPVASIRLSVLSRSFFTNAYRSSKTPPPIGPEPPADEHRAPELDDAKATLPPRIDSLSPLKAATGETVVLRGLGLAATTDVFFIKPACEPVAAAFRPLSDEKLEVDVPDSASGQQAIVVVNPAGLTVTAPKARARDEPLIHYVVAGETTTWNGEPRLYVVEQDGRIHHRTRSFTLFVKSGGEVGEPTGVGCFFYELGAVIPEAIKDNPANGLLEVKTIVLSTEVKPFFVE